MASSGPDLLLHNAQVYTVDERTPTAGAFVVRNGRFVAVGSTPDMTDTHPDLPRIDVGGRTVIPGLIDSHAHLEKLGLSLRRADLTGTPSPAAVVDRLLNFEANRNLSPETWLRGHGWDQNEWSPPRFPTRDRLDEAFPERPVWLIRTDIHAGWANTAALEATVGLDRLRNMDAPNGGRIHRDASGCPTGILIDAAMGLVADHIPPPTASERDRALTAALEHTARHGITGLHDAGVDHSSIRRFQRRIEEDRFPLRVYAMINGRGDTFDHFCEKGPLHHPSGRLNVDSVKFFADGALGSRGAALLDDYADDPGNHGLLLHDEEGFRHNVLAAIECGFQVNTHAIGDRATRMVLDAYEDARRQSSRPIRRPRIEHAQVVHPKDRARFGDLGVIASVQPGFALSDEPWVPDRLGPSRLTHAYTWKSLHDAGAPLAFGSDAPVDPVAPLRGFFAAVAPPNFGEQPNVPRHPPEQVNRATALHAYTLGAAYAAFQEDEIGSITPGKRADFAVLSDNIMTVPAPCLRDVEVVATYVDGSPIYTQADAFQV